LNELEKAVIKFLEKKKLENPNWKWSLGSKIFTAEELIVEFKKNKELREFILLQLQKFAAEQLLK
jgi:hypothetical protein